MLERPCPQEVEIARMEPWMAPAMADLHVREYSGDAKEETAKFLHRFASPYARENGAIALVGLDGDRVVAMQTYAPWPYLDGGRTLRSLQSGATLVDPRYRGRKLWQRMLAEGSRIAAREGVDLFLGFPAPASRQGLVRDGWSDVGQLRWWTRVSRPLRLLAQRARGTPAEGPLPVGEPLSPGALAAVPARREGLALAGSEEFLAWRFSPIVRERYRVVRWRSGGREIAFVVKASRGHGFGELTVGAIRSSDPGLPFLARGIARLLRAARGDPSISAVTMALLSPPDAVRAALLLNGFVPHRPTAPLLVKPIAAAREDVVAPARWRGASLEDLDTW